MFRDRRRTQCGLSIEDVDDADLRKHRVWVANHAVFLLNRTAGDWLSQADIVGFPPHCVCIQDDWAMGYRRLQTPSQEKVFVPCVIVPTDPAVGCQFKRHVYSDREKIGPFVHGREPPESADGVTVRLDPEHPVHIVSVDPAGAVGLIMAFRA